MWSVIKSAKRTLNLCLNFWVFVTLKLGKFCDLSEGSIWSRWPLKIIAIDIQSRTLTQAKHTYKFTNANQFLDFYRNILTYFYFKVYNALNPGAPDQIGTQCTYDHADTNTVLAWYYRSVITSKISKPLDQQFNVVKKFKFDSKSAMT